MKIKKLKDEQIQNAIKNKEFDEKIIKSKVNVAVIMSQSWCPQWRYTEMWLDELDEIPDLDIYVIIYDTKKYYEEFMAFKENIFGNYEIPYIRYYKDGKIIKESNYTSKESFLRNFNLL